MWKRHRHTWTKWIDWEVMYEQDLLPGGPGEAFNYKDIQLRQRRYCAGEQGCNEVQVVLRIPKQVRW